MSNSSSHNGLMKDSNNSSENGSSNGEVGGNNSDNSALVSLGNTSFGFNFDSEEGTNGSPRNSASNSEEGDSSSSDQGGGDRKKSRKKRNSTGKVSSSGSSHSATAKPNSSKKASMQQQEGERKKQQHQQRPDAAATAAATTQVKQPPQSNMTAGAAAAKISSDSSSSMRTATTNTFSSSHSDAASEAVANLYSIAKAAESKSEKQGLKRKAPDSATSTTAAATGDNESSNGYNSDDEGKAGGSEEQQSSAGDAAAAASANSRRNHHHQHHHHQEDYQDMDMEDDYEQEGKSDSCGGSQKGSGRKKKKLDDMKREERNAREKERSFRISRQINELRSLLSSGGVIVPKGTKSSVLTEAANYIRMLQQHQYRSEIDRHQLVQQIQMIGGGALGQQAADAVRHVAAQNGVWSLGNFGGVPPKSAMMYHQSGAPAAEAVTSQEAPTGQDGSSLPNKIEEGDYRHVFNSCTVAMAIASMGGAFIDCNKLFCQLSNYSKQEVCSMTVFNLTARQDLQPAFDLISQMLSAPADPNTANTSCVLRGSFKHRNDLGLNVALIKGEDGVAKCFCVTLIMNPASPFDTSRPVPATIELLGGAQQMLPTSKDASVAGMDPSPAYTAG